MPAIFLLFGMGDARRILCAARAMCQRICARSSNPGSGWPTQPERELMGTVLTTAIDDLLDRRSSPEAEAHRQDARAWIAGAAALMMFEAVCQALDLDPAAVRDAAARPRAAPVPELTPREWKRLRRDSGRQSRRVNGAGAPMPPAVSVRRTILAPREDQAAASCPGRYDSRSAR
jgi:hypothetical protein